MIATPLPSALRRESFLLLDGAIGTQLKLRGVDVAAALDGSDSEDDYWSGKALLSQPAAVAQLSEDYLRAGADVITTNTFRVNRSVVGRLGIEATAKDLLMLAVALAREARERAGAEAAIGASIGPVDYDMFPTAPEGARLRAVHEETAAALLEAGADILLPETLATIAEAVVLCTVAGASGRPFIVSFVLGRDGRLPSGEGLADAVDAVLELGPAAILVNHCPIPVATAAIRTLARTLAGTGVPFGLRPHLEKSAAAEPGDCTPDQFVEHARGWLDLGARVIGGCCGTTPAYIAGLAAMRLQIQKGVP